MGFLSYDEALERFKSQGRNSSHFVWFLTELRFYESFQGWVFGFIQIRGITFLALEPLIPGAPTEYTFQHEIDFDSAWNEFVQIINPRVVVFVSFYAPFLKLLKPLGFQTLKIGEEPWIDLKNCIPTGTAAKGVRSARNQALRAGVSIHEWPLELITHPTPEREEISKLVLEWKRSHLIDLGGFMNTVDPFMHPESRRYFVAKSRRGNLEAFVVATPIPGIQSYFLEDLIIKKGAPRGIAEFLLLEAMTTLGASGAKFASLGVISVKNLDKKYFDKIPHSVELLLTRTSRVLTWLYNFNGMDTFRKRFKPQKREFVFLGVKTYSKNKLPEPILWLKILFALLIAFKPKLQLSGFWLKQKAGTLLNTYPIAISVTLLSFGLFAGINHFGKLPDWALSHFSFTGKAPFSQWLLRSIVSDYIYFDPTHFWLSTGLLAFVIAWSERRHKRVFLIPFFTAVSIFDDYINYAVVIKPFSYLQPALFEKLISIKDVGGSLEIVTLVGLQFAGVRKNQDIFFTILVLTVILIFAFSSSQYHFFIINLNHFVFLCFGYIAGKIKLEVDQGKNRKASKGKTPLGHSLTPARGSA